jgi:hypothetical protein
VAGGPLLLVFDLLGIAFLEWIRAGIAMNPIATASLTIRRDVFIAITS